MSGHNRASNLGQHQTGTAFNGRFLEFSDGAPANNKTGFGKGAIGIDTTNGVLYVNNGDAEASSWTQVTGGGNPKSYTYTKGLERVNGRLLSGNARIAFAGDSTTDNFGFTADSKGSRLASAIVSKWTPLNWKGFAVNNAYASGAQSVGLTTSHAVSLSADFEFLVKDNYKPGLAASDIFDAAGIGPGYFPKGLAPIFIKSGATYNNFLIRALLDEDLTGTGSDGLEEYTPSTLFNESKNPTNAFFRGSVPVRGRFYHWITTATVDSGTQTDETTPTAIGGKSVVGTVDLNWVGGNAEYTIQDETSTSVIVSPTADGTSLKAKWYERSATIVNNDSASGLLWYQMPQLTVVGDGGDWSSNADKLFVPGHFVIERTDVDEGMFFVDLSVGGFTATHHMDEPAAAPNDRGYSDEFLDNLFENLDLNTVVIWLGINDSGLTSPGDTAANFKTNIETMLTRFRARFAAAGTKSQLRFLIISAADWDSDSGDRVQIGEYADKVMELPDEHNDVAAINFYQWWSDTYGAYSSYSGTKLSDGVHQTTATGIEIAEKLWAFINDPTLAS